MLLIWTIHVGSHIYWMEVYTKCSTEITTIFHCHCDRDATKVKAVPIIVEQGT